MMKYFFLLTLTFFLGACVSDRQYYRSVRKVNPVKNHYYSAMGNYCARGTHKQKLKCWNKKKTACHTVRAF